SEAWGVLQEDLANRVRFRNAKQTLLTLLHHRVIPIVNENDTVATLEIRYGDNDRLAARVAQMVSADCLILLSDVDGLYTGDPRTDSDARHIPEVTKLTKEHWDMAGGPGSTYGSGGMRTKLEAARIAMDAGCRMLIAPGQVSRPIQAVQAGARVTWFLPSSTPRAARKQWLAGMLQLKGRLTVDAGAKAALVSGKSLLPAGVCEVVGRFDRGDTVSIYGDDGRRIAIGITNYGHEEVTAIRGVRSDRIARILGHQYGAEVVHRNNLVLL
ncbi:MAG: glutamate 5-kinase, partial [Chloroflexi bacterium]|nr:glutamate 5-kinase [Chloroflexota bacterium]